MSDAKNLENLALLKAKLEPDRRIAELEAALFRADARTAERASFALDEGRKANAELAEAKRETEEVEQERCAAQEALEVERQRADRLQAELRAKTDAFDCEVAWRKDCEARADRAEARVEFLLTQVADQESALMKAEARLKDATETLQAALESRTASLSRAEEEREEARKQASTWRMDAMEIANQRDKVRRELTENKKAMAGGWIRSQLRAEAAEARSLLLEKTLGPLIARVTADWPNRVVTGEAPELIAARAALSSPGSASGAGEASSNLDGIGYPLAAPPGKCSVCGSQRLWKNGRWDACSFVGSGGAYYNGCPEPLRDFDRERAAERAAPAGPREPEQTADELRKIANRIVDANGLHDGVAPRLSEAIVYELRALAEKLAGHSRTPMNARSFRIWWTRCTWW